MSNQRTSPSRSWLAEVPDAEPALGGALEVNPPIDAGVVEHAAGGGRGLEFAPHVPLLHRPARVVHHPASPDPENPFPAASFVGVRPEANPLGVVAELAPTEAGLVGRIAFGHRPGGAVRDADRRLGFAPQRVRVLHSLEPVRQAADQVEAQVVVQRTLGVAQSVDVDPVADVHRAHVARRVGSRRAAVVDVVGGVLVARRIERERNAADANHGLRLAVAVGVVERERTLARGEPRPALGVVAVEVDHVVAVGVALEEAARRILVAVDLPHVAVAVEVHGEPRAAEPAVVEVADVHFVGLAVGVVVEVVDHAIDRAVGVVVGHVAVAVLVAVFVVGLHVAVVVDDPDDHLLRFAARGPLFAAHQHPPSARLGALDDKMLADGERLRPLPPRPRGQRDSPVLVHRGFRLPPCPGRRLARDGRGQHREAA